MNIYLFRQFFQFYRSAVTKYQLHSPFVFDLATAVVEDTRWYYAFRDVELLREAALASDTVLEVTDYGTGGSGSGEAPGRYSASVRQIVRKSSSTPDQGQGLFRLVNWARPHTILELGTSLGIGTSYLASAARTARLVSLEGCAACAETAKKHVEMLGLHDIEVRQGPFEATLDPALAQLQPLDFVFIDGNHRCEPTLRYFEQCLAAAHEKTVFVFDDMHGSPAMTQAWEQIREHSRVTLTVDFFDLSVAFINPDFREKFHWKVIRSTWKPWMFW